MPTLIRDFPNELVLTLATNATTDTLFSLVLLSRHFYALLHSQLRSRAPDPESSRAAIYWAVLSEDRSLARHVLENATNIAVIRERTASYQRPPSREYVYHRAPAKCPDDVLDWIMSQKSMLNIKDDGAKEDYRCKYTRAITYALDNNHHALLRLLLRSTSNEDTNCLNTLSQVIATGKKDATEIVLDYILSISNEAGYQEALRHALFKALLTGRENGSNYPHIEMLRFLFARGADINSEYDSAEYREAVPRSRITPVHLAAFLPSPDVLFLLLEYGAGIHMRDSTERTPLHKAALHGYPVVAKALLDKGADVGVQDRSGWTALSFAIKRLNASLVRVLLEGGADVNVRDNEGYSALHYAVKIGCNYRSGCCTRMSGGDRVMEILELLLEHGADINAQDEKGWTALHWMTSISTTSRRGRSGRRTAIIKLLQERGADVTLKDKEGRTAFDQKEEGTAAETSRQDLLQGVYEEFTTS